MIITFTVTKRAHWRALRDVTRRTLSYKISVGFFVVLPLLVVGFGLLNHADIGTFILENLVLLLMGPLLVFVGFPYLYRLNVSRAHQNNAMLANPQTFELTPEHFVMRGPLHNSDVQWDAIDRVTETRDTFLFFVSKYNAHFIPKEGLTPDEIQTLRGNLVKWLPGRVQLRSDVPRTEHAAA